MGNDPRIGPEYFEGDFINGSVSFGHDSTDLVIGGVLGTFVNFAPIQSLSDTFSQTYMAKYLFGENLLQGFFDKYLPFGTWIAGIVK